MADIDFSTLIETVRKSSTIPPHGSVLFSFGESSIVPPLGIILLSRDHNYIVVSFPVNQNQVRVDSGLNRFLVHYDFDIRFVAG